MDAQNGGWENLRMGGARWPVARNKTAPVHHYLAFICGVPVPFVGENLGT